jgi:hypothetical protein
VHLLAERHFGIENLFGTPEAKGFFSLQRAIRFSCDPTTNHGLEARDAILDAFVGFCGWVEQSSWSVHLMMQHW